jgi:hypothetical protein
MDDNQFNELSMLAADIKDALADIADSLRVLKQATLLDIRRLEAELSRQEQAQRQPQVPQGREQPQTRQGQGQPPQVPQPSHHRDLLSGRWPLRDGNAYGNVARQPQTETSPEPAVHADHPPGHLRSSDEC